MGVSASVALYKACDLASKLTQAGFSVRTVLTPHAARLVHPQLFEAVSGNPAQVSEWGKSRRTPMDHIELARWADLLVVAPATADLIARLAQGQAGDLLTTTHLAMETEKPRLLCPAMNPIMLQAPAVRRNLDQIRHDGWHILEPTDGHMACGEAGPGRLSEPAEILAKVQGLLS